MHHAGPSTGHLPIASAARQTRSNVIEVLRQDYIRTAWAKGLSERVIIIRHVLKNALMPVVTLQGMLFSGAVIAIQTFGDFLGFNPHCHVLCTDGGFYGKGMFRVSSWFIQKDLEKLFRYKVFKMLLSRKKITEDLIDMMMGWRHSGFNVYCGPRIQPGEEEVMENLARYIIRASFSQERMTYMPEESKVLYRSKDGKKENIFGALVPSNG